MPIQRILVTGGAGYIGSHTCVELLAQGYDVVCADNFSNSSREAMTRVERITGKKIPVHFIDFCDLAQVDELFAKESFDAAIHFAGHKAVGESVEQPLMYYENNILSLVNLCKGMTDAGVNNIIFSSSATVYGYPKTVPLTEESPVSAFNPYGRTKLYIEEILKDLHSANNDWNVSILRYFNPVGAHPSGLIGDNPTGIPNNLMPYITQVAVGELPRLQIFGDDYDTPDGTGVRDYIHVVDLAKGHVAALKRLDADPGYIVHNLGTGQGYSVLDLVHAFESANDVAIPYVITDRRPGDVPIYCAAVDKARDELGWTAEYGIDDMVKDAWKWQSSNPKGYV